MAAAACCSSSNPLCVKTPVVGRAPFGKLVVIATVESLSRYGVESDMSVTTLIDAVLVAVIPSKYASALELIPGKSMGLSVAPSVDGKNVDVVVQVN